MDIGDYVRVTGTVSESYGLTEITDPSVTVLGTAEVPDPVVLPTGNVSQEKWESVLVRIENVIVTNPDLGYGEWEVDDGSGPVRVDDLMYHYTPSEGQMFDYITGVLYYSYGNFKIEPRDENDILPVVPIQEIQGNTTDGGDASAYEGQVVSTVGVVTFVTSSGFAIQNGTGGPWSGIWVYTGSQSGGVDVSVGDYVLVRAKVNEYYGFTELNYAGTDEGQREIKVMGGTADVPDPWFSQLVTSRRRSGKGGYSLRSGTLGSSTPTSATASGSSMMEAARSG